MIRSVALAAIAVLAIGASSRPYPADRMLDGKTAGAPVSCLPTHGTPSSVASDGALVFRVNAKLAYRNDMNGCRVRDDDILITNLYGNPRLCRGDIARLVDRASRLHSGSCAFGEFVPYRTPR